MLNPNPPRMITVVLAVALILVGMSATIFPLDIVNAALDVVQGSLGTNLEVTAEIGCSSCSPVMPCSSSGRCSRASERWATG